MKDRISEIKRILRKPFEPNLQKFDLWVILRGAIGLNPL